jgi:hypothetical protein
MCQRDLSDIDVVCRHSQNPQLTLIYRMVVCHYSEYISEQKRLANLKGMNSAPITKTAELYLF